MMVRCLTIVLLCLTILSIQRVYSDTDVSETLQENWKCSGCATAEDASFLFQQIKWIIQYADRMSYLALDMSWLDRLTHPDTKLQLLFREFSSITKDRILIDDLSLLADNSVSLSPYDETYYVLALPVRNSIRSESRRIQTARLLDEFLSVNPCWVPLYEPHQLTGDNAPLAGAPSILYLIRLPFYNYYATCRLYTSIVERQFPSVCSYKQSRMVTYLYL